MQKANKIPVKRITGNGEIQQTQNPESIFLRYPKTKTQTNRRIKIQIGIGTPKKQKGRKVGGRRRRRRRNVKNERPRKRRPRLDIDGVTSKMSWVIELTKTTLTREGHNMHTWSGQGG